MLTIRFDNLDEVRAAYSPTVVERATRDTMKRLSAQAKTALSKEITRIYAIKAPEVKGAMLTRTRERAGEHVAYIVFEGRRLSLTRFTSGGMSPTRGSRPVVRTSRGKRYGARVKIMKSRGAKIIQGPVFWGKARAGRSDEGVGKGAWQIWKREGPSRDNIRRLTGPAIPQMARSMSARQAVHDLVQKKADAILADRLNFYSGRRSGVL